MSILKLAWRNLWAKPLNTLLSLILFALGVGLISLLLITQDQLRKNFEKNLAGVNLVIGAKGSPLQMILSSMYHVDAPTGNITVGQVKPFFNPRHPVVEAALPLSMGDSYRGYRIVGTTKDVVTWYNLELERGEWFSYDFDVTIGSGVARKLGLGLGHKFKSSHGLVDDEGLEHDDSKDFVVVGVLEPSGTIMDHLILTTSQTYWYIHDHDHGAHADSLGTHDHSHEDSNHDHTDDGHDHSGHDHAGHRHDEDQQIERDKSVVISRPLVEEDAEKSITNLLVKFRGNNIQALNMQRSINENTEMQAATPAIEITRLFSLMGSAEKALRMLALVIVIVSGLSIFISLFSSLRDRRYELALVRVMGGGRKTQFLLILLEGIIIAILGYLLGILLSHVGMAIMSRTLEADYRYDFSATSFLPEEFWLFGAAILLGIVASIIPAIQASRVDISETLSTSR